MAKQKQNNTYLKRTSELSVAKGVCIVICVVFLLMLGIHVCVATKGTLNIQVASSYVVSALSLILGGFSLWYIASLKYMRLSLSLVSVWKKRIKELKKPPLSEKSLSDEENKLFVSIADEIIRYIGKDEDIKKECTELKRITTNQNNRKEAYEKLNTINTLLDQKI